MAFAFTAAFTKYGVYQNACKSSSGIVVIASRQVRRVWLRCESEARVEGFAPRFCGLLVCFWDGIHELSCSSADMSTLDVEANSDGLQLTRVTLPYRHWRQRHPFRHDRSRPHHSEVFDRDKRTLRLIRTSSRYPCPLSRSDRERTIMAPSPICTPCPT